MASRVFVPTSPEKPCLYNKGKKFRSLCNTYMYLYFYLFTCNMWLNITLQAEPFLAVHAPISLLCNWEIKKALLRWSNWWLMKTAYTRFKFEMLSEFWIICCRFCGTCLFSSLETFGWLLVHSHLIGSRGRCWLQSPISFTSSACLPKPKRKHQHIQATTLVEPDMHIDM